MSSKKYVPRSVKRVVARNVNGVEWTVELEILTEVGFWKKRWQSDILFYRSEEGNWYERDTGFLASGMDQILNAAVRQYKWSQERRMVPQ
jgi:hypothetical protein